MPHATVGTPLADVPLSAAGLPADGEDDDDRRYRYAGGPGRCAANTRPVPGQTVTGMRVPNRAAANTRPVPDQTVTDMRVPNRAAANTRPVPGQTATDMRVPNRAAADMRATPTPARGLRRTGSHHRRARFWSPLDWY
ncbi:hypothetical protein GCM10010168_88730 [Actinoplanes ianthinogenes]|uniref:Uncharacterized protein n=1 Tax=Actinoplanes ianthinogenes TaxID=122358 RepID=A0ABM7LQ09_9ACTN|nr:hypothetical protein [Actinoplanes ianthinogenes]BCJ41366.1 hypothetical protein Aiant_20230 [Actinoplanes ianthinogenes]GGR56160.1 hypothetical protein GCM10010168_88730 [Actinoplanes ianthinogenes]